MSRIKYKDYPGEFVKKCPCSPEAVSCGYYNINLHTGCPYSCSYCILQTYLESKEPVFYRNRKESVKELEMLSAREKYIRIGTGELSDSLAYDDKTDTTEALFKIFRKFPDIVFEFKTKSVNISKLLKEKPEKNIVVSWSLNPDSIVQREEKGTPPLKKRLEALKKVQDRGYKIGIHFDPIIFTKDWEKIYSELINDISSIIMPERIAWWSLGALRFPESLKPHIFKHRGSGLFEGELIKTTDGKLRYFRPLREELFKYIRDVIRAKIGAGTPLYLCMEDREMWKSVFPEISAERENINKYLYESTFR